MNEPEPNIKQPDETIEPAADDSSKGDFTFAELQQAYARNFDHLGRRIDRPEGDE